MVLLLPTSWWRIVAGVRVPEVWRCDTEAELDSAEARLLQLTRGRHTATTSDQATAAYTVIIHQWLYTSADTVGDIKQW